MHIALVNATHAWGGVKTWMIELAESLTKAGHSVFTYARQDVFAAECKRRLGHGEVIRFGADGNPATVRRLMREFRRNDIDIVLTNVKKDLTTGGIAARLCGLPVVQFIGLPGDMRPTFANRCLDALLKPQYLCSCRFIADGFKEMISFAPRERVKVILNGKTVTDSPLAVNNPRRLIATQQLIKGKGHATLLHALAEIDLPWALDVAGTGAAAPELRELAEQLGIADRIAWHGFSTNVRGLLAQADIFLLASEYEGLPNTMQEAMAEGLLPVCREIGGVREVLDGPLLEWLVPENAGPEPFLAAIKRALTLPDAELLQLKNAARDACRRHCELGAKTAEFAAWAEGLIRK